MHDLGFIVAMASTKKILYQLSTTLLVLLFSLAGIVKISPIIYPPVYNDLVS